MKVHVFVAPEKKNDDFGELIFVVTHTEKAGVNL